MTPKEKARELRQLFAQELIDLTHFENLLNARIKECALIAVDGILCTLSDLCCDFGGNDNIEKEIEYWKEVKQEIDKL